MDTCIRLSLVFVLVAGCVLGPYTTTATHDTTSTRLDRPHIHRHDEHLQHDRHSGHL